MSTGRFAFKGLTPPDPAAPPTRLECSQWSGEKPTWKTNISLSLYIRALNELYAVSYKDPLSFYGIAGIHGYPVNLPWHNADGPHNTIRGLGKGKYIYCTHDMITFPTWHRPYMLLFEQAVAQHMLNIVSEWDKAGRFTKEDKGPWIDATNLWRLPYWDWALAGNELPEIYHDLTIEIRAPVGSDGSSSETVTNPLYRFQLNVAGKLTPMGNVPDPYPVSAPAWKDYSGTSRYGNNSDKNRFEGVNNFSNIGTALAKDYDLWNQLPNPIAISDMVYRMFTTGYMATWADFATTKTTEKNPPENWQGYLSVEMIHNLLHGLIGGNGQMSDPSVAAFDPVFFMHHCNIDRQIAIWQTLHSSIWFAKTDSPGASDPQQPFYYSQDDPYDSDYVRDWTKFGYQYSLLQRQPKESDQDYFVRIKTALSKDYPNTSDNMQEQSNEDVMPDEQELLAPSDAETAAAPPDETAQQPLQMEAPPAVPVPVENGGKLYPDYLINVLYDRYALNGEPYTIHFFLGDLPDAELTQLASSTTPVRRHGRHIGQVYTFSAKWLDHCATCAKNAAEKSLSTAQIPITLPMLRHAKDTSINDIRSLRPRAVERYLEQHLNWKAVTNDGQIIPMENLPRTRVFALKGLANHFPEPERLSHYHSYRPMAAATRNKRAGAHDAHYNNPQGGLHT